MKKLTMFAGMSALLLNTGCSEVSAEDQEKANKALLETNKNTKTAVLAATETTGMEKGPHGGLVMTIVQPSDGTNSSRGKFGDENLSKEGKNPEVDSKEVDPTKIVLKPKFEIKPRVVDEKPSQDFDFAAIMGVATEEQGPVPTDAELAKVIADRKALEIKNAATQVEINDLKAQGECMDKWIEERNEQIIAGLTNDQDIKLNEENPCGPV